MNLQREEYKQTLQEYIDIQLAFYDALTDMGSKSNADNILEKKVLRMKLTVMELETDLAIAGIVFKRKDRK